MDTGDAASPDIWRGVDDEAERRLMVAIVLQAVKDLGNDDKERSVEAVLWWTKTRWFRTICNYIDLDHTEVRRVLEDLASYELPVRREMLKDIMTSVKTPR